MEKYNYLNLDFRKSETQNLVSFDRLSGFYAECFTREYDPFLDVEEKNSLDLWLKGTVAEDIIACAYPDTETIVCMRSGELCGTVVFAERQGYVYVWGLYVHPDKIKTGLGRQLMKEVARSVSPESAVEVSVLIESQRALDFYKHLGFRTYKSEEVELFPNVFREAEVMQCATKLLL